MGDIKTPITPSLAPFEAHKIARGAYGLGRMIHHDATPVATSGCEWLLFNFLNFKYRAFCNPNGCTI